MQVESPHCHSFYNMGYSDQNIMKRVVMMDGMV